MPPARRSRNLVSLADAAKQLDVNPRTVRRWIAGGRLPGYRLGPRVLRVEQTDLDNLPEKLPTATRRTSTTEGKRA